MLRIFYVWTLILTLVGAAWADGTAGTALLGLRSEITVRDGRATFVARPKLAPSRDPAIWFVAVPEGSVTRPNDEARIYQYQRAPIHVEAFDNSLGDLSKISPGWLILGLVGLLRKDRRRPVATFLAAGFFAIVLAGVLYPVRATTGWEPRFDSQPTSAVVGKEFREFGPADRSQVVSWAASHGVELPAASVSLVDAALTRKEHLVAWVIPAGEAGAREVQGPSISLPKGQVILPAQFGSAPNQSFTHQVLVDAEQPTVVSGLTSVRSFRPRQLRVNIDAEVWSQSLADEGYVTQARAITMTDHPVRTSVVPERVVRGNQVQLAWLGGATVAFLLGFGLGTTSMPRNKKLAIWGAAVVLAVGVSYVLAQPRGAPIGSEWRLINSRPDRLPRA